MIAFAQEDLNRDVLLHDLSFHLATRRVVLLTYEYFSILPPRVGHSMCVS